MNIRRILLGRRKPPPRIVIRGNWAIRDPMRDERDAQVEIRVWADRWVAPTVSLMGYCVR
jgi:hypothetical protein